MPASKAASSWTCDECAVTASWAADAAKPKFPHGWVREGGKTLCLGCRRELAGEAGADAMADDAPNDKRLQAKTHARIEFEVKRDPSRRDNAIAQACHTSVVAVRKARERLGVKPVSED
jgi:hypothetical protein